MRASSLQVAVRVSKTRVLKLSNIFCRNHVHKIIFDREPLSSFHFLSVDSGSHFFGFTMLSNWFCITTPHGWGKNSCYVVIQTELRPKLIATRSHAFSRALCQLHVFTTSFDCFGGFCVSFVISQVMTLLLVLWHSIKNQNQGNPSNQSQRTQTIQWTNQNPKHMHVTDTKRWFLLLIGWETGASFFNQSAIIGMKNQSKVALLLTIKWKRPVSTYISTSSSSNNCYLK